jgi:hypothetical protein
MGTTFVQRLLRNREPRTQGTYPYNFDSNPLAVSGEGHVNRCSQSPLLRWDDLAG